MSEETEIKTITAKELTKKILNHEEVFILDVRNTDDFDDWKIEGKNVHVINKPYFDLLDGVDSIVDKLPKDQEIYVVCAKGGSSEFVAGEVAEAGFTNVYSIKDGMNGWSKNWQFKKWWSYLSICSNW